MFLKLTGHCPKNSGIYIRMDQIQSIQQSGDYTYVDLIGKTGCISVEESAESIMHFIRKKYEINSIGETK